MYADKCNVNKPYMLIIDVEHIACPLDLDRQFPLNNLLGFLIINC